MKSNRVMILKARLEAIERKAKEYKRLGVKDYFKVLNKIELETDTKELASLAASLGYKDLQRYFSDPSKSSEKEIVMRNVFKARLFKDYAPDDLRMN